jgi:hypothetical protein
MFAIALVERIGGLLELSRNLPDVILDCFEATVSAFFEREWSIGESRIQSTFMGMERDSQRLAQSSSEKWSTRILVGFFERIMDRIWREADFRSETAYARDTSG